MRKTLIPLVILASLLIPALAQADPNIDLGVQIAHRMWPDSPCYGREQIDTNQGPLGKSNVTINGATETATINGLAWADECRVLINVALSSSMVCKVTVHEFGHLAGLGHTDAPNNVMNPDLSLVDVPGCPLEPLPQLTLNQARIWVYSYVDRHRKLTCKRLAWASIRCLARRSGHRSLWVTVTGDYRSPDSIVVKPA